MNEFFHLYTETVPGRVIPTVDVVIDAVIEEYKQFFANPKRYHFSGELDYEFKEAYNADSIGVTEVTVTVYAKERWWSRVFR